MFETRKYESFGEKSTQQTRGKRTKILLIVFLGILGAAFLLVGDKKITNSENLLDLNKIPVYRYHSKNTGKDQKWNDYVDSITFKAFYLSKFLGASETSDFSNISDSWSAKLKNDKYKIDQDDNEKAVWILGFMRMYQDISKFGEEEYSLWWNKVSSYFDLAYTNWGQANQHEELNLKNTGTSDQQQLEFWQKTQRLMGSLNDPVNLMKLKQNPNIMISKSNELDQFIKNSETVTSKDIYTKHRLAQDLLFASHDGGILKPIKKNTHKKTAINYLEFFESQRLGTRLTRRDQLVSQVLESMIKDWANDVHSGWYRTTWEHFVKTMQQKSGKQLTEEDKQDMKKGQNSVQSDVGHQLEQSIHENIRNQLDSWQAASQWFNPYQQIQVHKTHQNLNNLASDYSKVNLNGSSVKYFDRLASGIWKNTDTSKQSVESTHLFSSMRHNNAADGYTPMIAEAEDGPSCKNLQIDGLKYVVPKEKFEKMIPFEYMDLLAAEDSSKTADIKENLDNFFKRTFLKKKLTFVSVIYEQVFSLCRLNYRGRHLRCKQVKKEVDQKKCLHLNYLRFSRCVEVGFENFSKNEPLTVNTGYIGVSMVNLKGEVVDSSNFWDDDFMGLMNKIKLKDQILSSRPNMLRVVMGIDGDDYLMDILNRKRRLLQNRGLEADAVAQPKLIKRKRMPMRERLGLDKVKLIEHPTVTKGFIGNELENLIDKGKDIIEDIKDTVANSAKGGDSTEERKEITKKESKSSQ